MAGPSLSKPDLDRLLSALAGGVEEIAAAGGLARVEADVAALFDHTLLRPEASTADIRKLCSEAVRHNFATVVVNPANVALASALTCMGTVGVCTVAGFPLGATLRHVKAFEAEQAIRAGATEVDMVIHIGALVSRQDDAVEADIRGVVEACHARSAICKVILETALLTQEEKVLAAEIAVNAGADFVKTSTGFGAAGATPEDVALLRATVGPDIGVKAAGGIRTLTDLRNMVAAGANRIGSSSSVKILEELRQLAAGK